MRYSIYGATAEQVTAAGAAGVKVTRHTGTIFATLTEAAARKLTKSGATVIMVEKVRPDTTLVVPTPIVPTPVAGEPIYTPQNVISLMGLADIREQLDVEIEGEGYNCAVLDTGIRDTHTLIPGEIVYAKDYTGSGSTNDIFNHGTSVAHMFSAIAPKAGILNMKVMGDLGEGTEEEVVDAIDECIDLYEARSELAPRIINLSLGCSDVNGSNSPIRVACRAAIEAGLLVLAACGNGGPNAGTVTSPASEQYVGACGSCKVEPFTISSFSSRGPTSEGLTKPDAVLFGENLNLASSDSDTATAAKSGTSFTSPAFCAIVILFIEGAEKRTEFAYLGTPTYEEVYHLNASDMLDIWLPQLTIKPTEAGRGKDDNYGWGLPFGELIVDVFRPTMAFDMSSLMSMMVAMMMMGMMTRMVK